MKQVVVYSKPSCVPCQSVKQWLELKGIEYTEVSAFNDPDSARAMKIRTVPTTLLLENGEEIGRVAGLKIEIMEDLFGYVKGSN